MVKVLVDFLNNLEAQRFVESKICFGSTNNCDKARPGQASQGHRPAELKGFVKVEDSITSSHMATGTHIQPRMKASGRNYFFN